MIINLTIDTKDGLTDGERADLAVLFDLATSSPAVTITSVEKPEAPAKPAPVKKVAPAKPAPVVEETPEPEETSLRDQAVARVTELLGKGEGKRVKAALSDLGVAKVSLLSDEDLPAFITELA